MFPEKPGVGRCRVNVLKEQRGSYRALDML